MRPGGVCHPHRYGASVTLGKSKESPVRDDAIARAERFSPFLENLIGRHAETVALFRKQGAEVALAAALAAIPADLAAGARLRRMKQVIALVTALADLAGEWPLEKGIAHLRDRQGVREG